MNRKATLTTGALLMAAGVALGAFGAHAWKESLAATGRTETFELAIRYLLTHALAILILGALMKDYPRLHAAAKLLLAGIFLFSGSLVVLALTNKTSWGPVAPFGGAALISGWLAVAYAIMRASQDNRP